MKDAGPAVKTHHPFGDPNATQFSQRDELMRELMMRTTQERMQPVQVPPDPLAAVSGEISVPARHGWTVVAVILMAVVLAACVAIALAT